MKKSIVYIFIVFVSLSCKDSTSSKSPSRQDQVKAKASEFFATFSDRSDWEKFCSYYREDIVFEDIILQLQLDSLWQLKRFYKWDEEGEAFKKLSPEQHHLTLYSLVANDSTAVGRGRVNPFYYHGEKIDSDWGMEFTIWLYFDDNLKITKQVDWFEYDSGSLESMLKRCKENGFEAIPEWLDLGKRDGKEGKD